MAVGYEVEFIQVGSGERNGDAIVVRYGELGVYKIMVYDGGTKAAGQALVDHIKTHYGATHVDYVVNSHPDADHASGLTVVLDQLTVGAVYMHRPWEHSSIILDYFHDGRITDESLAERLKTKMAAAYEFEQLALSKGIQVIEPFQGMQIGSFYVMSPERDWYLHDLIADFTKSPKAKEVAAADGQGLAGALRKIYEEAKATVMTWVDEHWHIETLQENSETSAENESSVVLYAYLAERGLLITGDAGNQALKRVADYAQANNMNLPALLRFVQMPHHGSRHNVSPSVLDRILGPKLTADTTTSRTAFVSCSSECTTHPRRVVTNAFRRRGFSTSRHKTPAMTWIRSSRNMPDRASVPLEAIPWFAQVEG